MSTEAPFDQAPTAPMDRHECLARLALEPVGRLIVPRDHLPPAVVPAVYLLAGETLLLRPARDLLPALRRRQRMIFEVERIDADRRRGWSILVEGDVNDGSDHDDAPGAAQQGDEWLWLSIDIVRGRRIGEAPPSPEPGW